MSNVTGGDFTEHQLKNASYITLQFHISECSAIYLETEYKAWSKQGNEKPVLQFIKGSPDNTISLKIYDQK